MTNIPKMSNILYTLAKNVASNVSLHTKIDKPIGKGTNTFARLTARISAYRKLSIHTNTNVCCSYKCSTLLYGNKK